MSDDYFKLYETMKQDAKYATEHGLQAEYFAEFFNILDVTKEQVARASRGAIMEWDMYYD
jgi:hypothetical protein